MTAPARVLHLSLDLLDRQLLDRSSTPCGNVDDVELTVESDGTVRVTALLTGPGMLAPRLGVRRLGEWLHRASRQLRPDPEGRDRSRVPIELAYEIGPAVRIAVDATDLASHDLEGWTRDHVVGKVPGARHAPE